jgi:MFS family permease
MPVSQVSDKDLATQSGVGDAGPSDAVSDDEGPSAGWMFGAVLVLLSSAIVLVAEIVAMRVIAPYVGVTLETTSAVIGIVLAGISLGSWIGGWLADRTPTRALLTASLAIGGFLLSLSPWIVRQVGPDLTPSNPWSAVLLTAAAFLLPSIALSAVTPTVLKGLGQGSRHLGSVAGAISAIGTAGALIGNFSAGFVLVGNLRASQILIICGAVSLVLAAVTVIALGGLPKSFASGRTAAAVVLVIAAFGSAAFSRELPCDAETKYTCLNIDTDDGDTFTFQTNLSFQSSTKVSDPTYLEYLYVNDIANLSLGLHPPAEEPTSFGYVGGGGFTLPLYFEAVYPGSKHVVYEIDEELVDRMTTVLGIEDRDARFPTRIGDARAEIATTPSDSMDVVVGDAFSGLTVPWQLTTKEWLEEIDRVLTDDGVYIMNLIDAGGLDLARAEMRTFSSVFDDVAVAIQPAFLEGDDVGPGYTLLIGGRNLPDAAELQLYLDQTLVTTALEGDALDEFIGDATELTDDFAPVDQLIGDTYQ